MTPIPMTMSDLIQYAIIATIAGFSLWRLVRPFLRSGAASSESAGGCGSGEGCGSCKGCGALSALTPPAAKGTE